MTWHSPEPEGHGLLAWHQQQEPGESRLRAGGDGHRQAGQGSGAPLPRKQTGPDFPGRRGHLQLWLQLPLHHRWEQGFPSCTHAFPKQQREGRKHGSGQERGRLILLPAPAHRPLPLVRPASPAAALHQSPVWARCGGGGQLTGLGRSGCDCIWSDVIGRSTRLPSSAARGRMEQCELPPDPCCAPHPCPASAQDSSQHCAVVLQKEAGAGSPLLHLPGRSGLLQPALGFPFLWQTLPLPGPVLGNPRLCPQGHRAPGPIGQSQLEAVGTSATCDGSQS